MAMFRMKQSYNQDSIFPKTENKLNKEEYEEALKYVGRNKDIDEYHSLIDFLFCEIFTQYKYKALQSYKGLEKKLFQEKELTETKKQTYDLFLCNVALELIMTIYKDKQKISWKDLRKILMVFVNAIKL